MECEHKTQVWHDLDGVKIYGECIDCGEQLYNPGTYSKDFREVVSEDEKESIRQIREDEC